MPTWYQLNCAQYAFKLKGHRVTVRLKSLPSMIYILLFAKRQWESFNYIHTDIILCREVLFWMQDLLLVGWPSANAHIHSVWCWSHERKSKVFLKTLDLYIPSSRSGGKERTTKAIDEIQARFSGRIKHFHSSNQHRFRMSSLPALGVRRCNCIVFGSTWAMLITLA